MGPGTVLAPWAGLPCFANYNTAQPVEFEFQINSEYFFSIYILHRPCNIETKITYAKEKY